MPKTKREFALAGLKLDASAKKSLYLQLYEALRQAILEKQLRPGEQLPPTRELATDLSVSRTTVLLAFDHLLSEGYIEGKSGAGTFVSETIPEDLLEVCTDSVAKTAPFSVLPKISGRGERIKRVSVFTRKTRVNLQPFRPGIPALREFPQQLWTKLLARESRSISMETLGYGDPCGFRPLREAIADYLRISRAVRCDADQVIITNGSQQAIDLVNRVLLDEGEAAWTEEPGYSGFKESVASLGGRLIPVKVDEKGLCTTTGNAADPAARLAYVTPSHQYPLGVTMTLSRRIQLLDWAAKSRAWILEDDYDSEYRYTGHPISSLQGLDRNGCVIYMGTFSKVLFPGLGLGYLVVPHSLVDAFVAARSLSERQGSVITQATLAAFIEEGHFARHIRQMRMLYHERREMLLAALDRDLGGALSIFPTETGLQVTAKLHRGSDLDLTEKAAKIPLDVRALSTYYHDEKQSVNGIVLGFAAFDETEIANGVQSLAKLISG
ncbi:MAG: PLP-dependent aminotransferase family protein [Calditrichia bacterium]